MSEPQPISAEPGASNREDQMSMLFAQMVVQQSNLAMMLLGQTPHPQSGQKIQDIEAARMFIDQLEMLEAKTKGNLSREEQALLKQTLMSLRLAFVEAVNAPAAGPADPAATSAPEPRPAVESVSGDAAPPASEPEGDSKKKFSKKY